jgi:hypothetical protein
MSNNTGKGLPFNLDGSAQRCFGSNKNTNQANSSKTSVERKFLTEIDDLEKQFHPDHAPTLTRIIEKKIGFLK